MKDSVIITFAKKHPYLCASGAGLLLLAYAVADLSGSISAGLIAMAVGILLVTLFAWIDAN